MKDRLVSLIKLVVSLGLLILLFRIFDWRQSWRALREMDLRFFAAALLLFVLSLLIRSFRWRYLLEGVDMHVPVMRLFYLYVVGTFFNTFLPSGFGGDAVKMYELNRYSQRGSESVGTVLLDRFSGLIMLFFMALVALPFVYGGLPSTEAAVLTASSLAGLLGAWVLFRRRVADRVLALLPGVVRDKLQALYDAVHTSGTRALWKALAVSALFNLALFGLNYSLALAVGARVSFLHVAAFMPLLSLSMLLPSVGALGTREAAYVLLFGSAGVDEPVAIAMSLAFYALNILIGIVGAVLYAVAAMGGLRTAPGAQSK